MRTVQTKLSERMVSLNQEIESIEHRVRVYANVSNILRLNNMRLEEEVDNLKKENAELVDELEMESEELNNLDEYLANRELELSDAHQAIKDSHEAYDRQFRDLETASGVIESLTDELNKPKGKSWLSKLLGR